MLEKNDTIFYPKSQKIHYFEAFQTFVAVSGVTPLMMGIYISPYVPCWDMIILNAYFPSTTLVPTST